MTSENTPEREAHTGRILGCVIPIVVVLFGGGVAATLVATKPEAATEPSTDPAVPVDVINIEAGPTNAYIPAQGTVMPAQHVTLMPEVAGNVVWQDPRLMPGATFEAGDVIAKIDPRDYQAAIAQQQANVAQAKLALEQEKGRQLIAQKEWDLLGGDDKAVSNAGKSLALREPQLVAAQANLVAAQAALAQASVNLGRTEIRIPFNAMIQTESVDIGQRVQPGAPVASIVGTDAYWVQAPVPLEHLPWITMPGPEQPGSEAIVRLDAGDKRVERKGRVVRLLGDVDTVGRMARLLIEVPMPTQPAPTAGTSGKGAEGDRSAPINNIPLFIGATVEVELKGQPLTDVLSIPRRALREGNTVYAVDGDELRVVKLDIVWRAEDFVYARGDLSEGADLIVSPLKGAVSGMKLRVLEEAASEGKQNE